MSIAWIACTCLLLGLLGLVLWGLAVLREVDRLDALHRPQACSKLDG